MLACFVPITLALALQAGETPQVDRHQAAIDRAIDAVGLPPSPEPRRRHPWSWQRAALWHGVLIAGDLLVTEVHLSRDPAAWEGNPLPGMDTRRGRVTWLSGMAVASVAVDALAHRLLGRKGSLAWRASTGLWESGAICGHLNADCPISTGRVLSALHIQRHKPSVLHAIQKTARPAGLRKADDRIPSRECRGGGACIMDPGRP